MTCYSTNQAVNCYGRGWFLMLHETELSLHQIWSFMKKHVLVLVLLVGGILFAEQAAAQCSICTKTAQQLGEKPAQGMNSGILYLAFTPFAIVGYISYRWWKNNKS